MKLFTRFFSANQNKNNKQNSSPFEDAGLKAISWIMLVGVAAMFFVCVLPSGGYYSLAIFFEGMKLLGISSLVAFASSLSGGLLGFLFGVPRSLLTNSTTAPPEPPGEKSNNSNYQDNTNLEQISDWLTKIIVGASITQIPQLKDYVDSIARNITTNLASTKIGAIAYTYMSATLVFYFICGFLLVYLWSRIYLKQQLSDLSALREVSKIKNQIDKNILEKEIEKIKDDISTFKRQAGKIKTVESDEKIKHVIESAKPNAITYLDDCQKERWGSLSQSGGLQASAEFDKDPIDGDESYLVTIKVSPVPGTNTLLNGSVYFFLHDSYFPKCILDTTAINNVASISVASYEAFTVGIYCLESGIKLELDLNILPNVPDDYKYTEPLFTINQLQEELEQLSEKDN